MAPIERVGSVPTGAGAVAREVVDGVEAAAAVKARAARHGALVHVGLAVAPSVP